MGTGRFKVFQAQLGFYQTVVAAPSQAAALRAWGTHQNLFANGEAKIATDANAIAAALKHPEIPLRRALGSHGPFELEPKTRPRVPEAAKPPAPAVKSRPAPSPAPPRPAPARPAPPGPAPDRSALQAAEAALCQLDRARQRQQEALRRRQEQLAAETVAARAAYADARAKAASALARARAAYRRAGGKD